jgi:hypothetical protein
MYMQMMQMQQQMIMLAGMLDQANGSNYAEQMAAQFSGGAMPSPMGGMNPANVEETEALGGKEGAKEASNTKKARQRVAESTSPT